MKISKVKAYFLIMLIGVLSCLLFQGVWAVSHVTEGEVIEFGNGPGRRFKGITSVTIRYSVSGVEYVDTYLRSGVSLKTQVVPIRYLTFAPSVSRLNTPSGNWGLISALFLVFFLSVTILFLKNDIVPHRSYFTLNTKRPFVTLTSEN